MDAVVVYADVHKETALFWTVLAESVDRVHDDWTRARREGRFMRLRPYRVEVEDEELRRLVPVDDVVFLSPEAVQCITSGPPAHREFAKTMGAGT